MRHPERSEGSESLQILLKRDSSPSAQNDGVTLFNASALKRIENHLLGLKWIN
jgi:hypothetical protein